MTNTRRELADYATQYKIGAFVLAWRGTKWSIHEGSFDKCCYDKSLNAFNYEPLPSNMSKEHFKDCRFGLLEAKELVEKWNKYKEKEVK